MLLQEFQILLVMFYGSMPGKHKKVKPKKEEKIKKIIMDIELSKLGVRQFVRNIICDSIGKAKKGGNTDELIKEINKRLIDEYAIIAKEESKRVFVDIGKLLKGEKI